MNGQGKSLDREQVSEVALNKLRSIAFFQGQSTGQEEARISRKGMVKQKKAISKIPGDVPVEPEIMSNWSLNSER